MCVDQREAGSSVIARLWLMSVNGLRGDMQRPRSAAMQRELASLVFSEKAMRHTRGENIPAHFLSTTYRPATYNARARDTEYNWSHGHHLHMRRHPLSAAFRPRSSISCLATEAVQREYFPLPLQSFEAKSEIPTPDYSSAGLPRKPPPVWPKFGAPPPERREHSRPSSRPTTPSRIAEGAHSTNQEAITPASMPLGDARTLGNAGLGLRSSYSTSSLASSAYTPLSARRPRSSTPTREPLNPLRSLDPAELCSPSSPVRLSFRPFGAPGPENRFGNPLPDRS